MAFRVPLPPIYRGAAYKKSFLWCSQGDDEVLTPIDLTGKNGIIQLRERADTPVFAEWSTANGKLIFSDVNRISILVLRPETDAYLFDHAQWNMLIWDAGNTDEAEVLMYGEVDCPESITDID